MGRWLRGVIVIMSVLVWWPAGVGALGGPARGSVGLDVSWPNCTLSQPSGADFGIVGVTGGKNFRLNLCLAEEAAWFHEPMLYANTGYPGAAYAQKYAAFPLRCQPADQLCLAYNYGFNAGRLAADYALRHGIVSSKWWLDVETVNSWTPNTKQNRQALTGQVAALNAAGSWQVGYYSIPSMWHTITGDWQNAAPNWMASGQKSLSAARSYCRGYNFTGGGTQLVQLVPSLDADVVC